MLAPEKQRRLCLSVDHESCATFLAAAEARDSLMPPNRVGIDETLVRPYPRMAPVLLDDRRVAALPDIARRQGLGQLGLVLLIGIASAAILLARLPGAGQGPGQALPGGAAAPSPAGAPVVTASGREAESSLSASADTGNSARPSPSTTSAVQSPEPTPSAAASQGGRTYRVRPGDTLARIAGRFGTSAKAIMVRNGISDPRRIQIGAVLVIP